MTNYTDVNPTQLYIGDLHHINGASQGSIKEVKDERCKDLEFISPPLFLSHEVILPLNCFCNDNSRSFMKIRLNKKEDTFNKFDINTFIDKIMEIDKKYASDDFKEKFFGENKKNYEIEYYPILKHSIKYSGEESDEDVVDDDEMYFKVKIPHERGRMNIPVKVVSKNYSNKEKKIVCNNIRNINHAAKVITRLLGIQVTLKLAFWFRDLRNKKIFYGVSTVLESIIIEEPPKISLGLINDYNFDRVKGYLVCRKFKDIFYNGDKIDETYQWVINFINLIR